MIISKMYQKLDSFERQDLVGGLVWGLVWGLVLGLVWGLVWGLVVILVNLPEAYPFLTSFKEGLLIILGIFIIVEILFWIDNSKPSKGENRLWFTFKRKIEALFKVLLGLSGISYIYILGREIKISINLQIEILKWVGYIGVGIIGLILIAGIIYAWIKLNSLKFKEETKLTRRNKK